MIYETLSYIDWGLWITRALEGVSVGLFGLILIWVLPLFLGLFLGCFVNEKIKDIMVTTLRVFMGALVAFIVGDILGMDTSMMSWIFSSFFSVGIAWAIKDNIGNAFSGFIVLFSNTFEVGDRITSERGGFDGFITAFHTQSVVILDQGKGVTVFIPNSLLWTCVIMVRKPEPDNYNSVIRPFY